MMMSRYLLLFILCLAEFMLFGQPPKDLIYWTAQWSPDGKYLAIGANEEILIFDGQTFEKVKKYHDDAHVERVRWHPDKNILAVADTGPYTRLIDVYTDQTTYLKGEHPNPSRAVVWNPEGTMIANADYEGVTTIWDIDGKKLRAIPKENSKGYVAIDWHPLGKEIIALSEFIRVYDQDGNLLKKIAHRDEKVLMLCVEWHPSGDFFVIGDYGDYDFGYPPLLRFWDREFNLIKTVRHSKAEYRNLDWSPDAEKLATASDALRIWSKGGELIAESTSSDDYLWGIGWRPDGKYLVTSSSLGKIQIWNKDAQLVRELEW